MFLRKNQNMKIMPTCRQIKSLLIENNEVSINATEEVLNELFDNYENKQRLIEFLNIKGLSLKEYKKNIEVDKELELKKWLGEKIIIK